MLYSQRKSNFEFDLNVAFFPTLTDTQKNVNYFFLTLEKRRKGRNISSFPVLF
jgi:hypothetical protein